MPRLFTGLEIPSTIATQLSLLRGGLRGARWIDPENYHITLRYMGEVDDRIADEVAFELGRVRREPVSLTIQELGSFGSGKPHSLWAGVKPCPALFEMQAEQERILRRLGFAAQTRRYTPHITLARLKGTSDHEVASWLSMRSGYSAQQFTVERFVLFSSRSSVGGGPYLVEEAYPLAA
ncbi:RNA 2',3'-cyclic phosphodiesterase [Polycladidibacter stylochi]|uniref:RNA 2',3'-cyclic phosphodiesterase n=1 Tax=Polycladidibacter stylochi TaxID=1807766 RepID=UPI00082F1EFF|nr:RNA 2',3'-cyclic phosphodiesterase [Pseudovibrio stylochi]